MNDPSLIDAAVRGTPGPETSRPDYLAATDLVKSFRLGGTEINVLRGVSLQVKRGAWTALLGASGSGKTTLLDILGTLSKPDSGLLTVAGRDLLKLSSRELVEYRRKKIGFVFQSYHILPELNVLENVMLPALLDGQSRKKCRARAAELLDLVGLAERLRHRSNELSGGEQQRCAIARALMNRPELLLADEPTGNLDQDTGLGILAVFREIRRAADMTLIMVTHDRAIAALADSVVELSGGRIRETSPAGIPG